VPSIASVRIVFVLFISKPAGNVDARNAPPPFSLAALWRSWSFFARLAAFFACSCQTAQLTHNTALSCVELRLHLALPHQNLPSFSAIHNQSLLFQGRQSSPIIVSFTTCGWRLFMLGTHR